MRANCTAVLGLTGSLGLVCALGACEREQPGTPPAPARQSTPLPEPAFVPSRNGFAFANNFPGVPLPTLVAPGNGNTAKSAFGLCGGMSAAAADYFLAGLAPPDSSALPERGSALYEYLFLRQAQSFGPGVATALRFAEWTAKSDRELNTLTNIEIDSLARELRTRPVVPIGLIIARPGGPQRARHVTDNHQVLAYALNREDGAATVRIYDPNFPRDDGVVIVLHLLNTDQPVGFRNRPKGKSTAIRGLFVLPYEPAIPPAANSASGPR